METKKRILVFIPEFPVLTETFIEREIAKLVERGNVDLHVFSLKKGRGYLSEVLLDKVTYERISLKDTFKFFLFFVSKLSYIKKAFSEILKSIKENKKNHGKVKNPGFMKVLYVFLKSCAYAEKFSKFKPDFILAHFFSEPSTMVMYISKILNVPYGISAHAKDILVEAQYPKEKVQTAKFISICNENAYNYVLKQAGDLDKSNIYLAYHGVDIEKIKKGVEDRDYRPEKPLILAIGRLVEKKGLEYLIKSARNLKEREVNFEIKIIGSGPLYPELLNLINELDLQDDVVILGENKGLSNEDTLLHLKSASVLSFPSIETKEGDVDGVANVLFEAGIFKIPVVATDAGSTGELIIHNQTGLVVPQKDSNIMADKLELILNDKDLSQKLGNNLYNKVSEKFSLDKNIVQLENMLLRNY